MTTMMQSSQKSIVSRSPEADPVALKHVLDRFSEEYHKKRPDLSEKVTEIYKSVFTTEEATAISKFFQSELGQIFLQGSLRIEKRLQPFSEEWSKQASRDAFERAVQ